MEDWQIREYEENPELHNKTLVFRSFDLKQGEHLHCELCWNRFSLHNEDLQIGYLEEETKSWICQECFDECGNLFGWKIKT